MIWNIRKYSKIKLEGFKKNPYLDITSETQKANYIINITVMMISTFPSKMLFSVGSKS